MNDPMIQPSLGSKWREEGREGGLQIYYFGYRYNGKATKVGVEDKGLRVCIADDSYSGISFELVQFILKLRAEISAFQIVNGTGKLLRFSIVCSQPTTFCP